MNVDGDRLRADVEANAAFGAVETDAGHGRTVLAGSEANREARDYLVERMTDAELDVRVDAVGNVAGRWTPPTADPDAAPVATGSHLDSVPEGGIFDGPLGVYASLEAVRALQAADVALARPVEVVSFTEEEGTRFAPLLGSSVAAGKRSVQDALAETDDDGVTLADALSGIGYRGEGALDAASWDSWLELHVEQGRRLEAADVPVGVVTAITGILHLDVDVVGSANHAGTTPMDERTDALVAAAEFVRAAERAANDVASDTAVATVGKLGVAPNATNVVPGSVHLAVDVRDVERESIDAIRDALADELGRLERDRGVETAMEAVVDIDPTPMADRARDVLHAGATDAGVEAMDLHSGAGHDSMHVASVTDAGMFFAPSVDGVSHHPAEWTDWEDCATAASVLAAGLRRLASE